MYYLSRSSLLYAILYFFFYKHKIILHVMCYVEDLHSNKYLLDSRICGNIYGFKLGISTKKKNCNISILTILLRYFSLQRKMKINKMKNEKRFAVIQQCLFCCISIQCLCPFSNNQHRKRKKNK